MADGASGAAEFERHTAEIAQASSPAEVLDRLLDSALLAAPRAVLFVVRKSRLRAWKCAGHSAETGRRFAGADIDASEGWTAPLLDPGGTLFVARPPEARGPDFGQPSSAEAAAAVVRAGGAAVALLIVEREADEVPWGPRSLAVLVRFASLRLELDLARRTSMVPASPREGASPATAVAGADVAEAPPPAATGPLAPGSDHRPFDPDAGLHPSIVAQARVETGLALAQEPATSASGASGREGEARRFARLVATDIRLYNEEAVVLGRRRGDLAARLAEQLQRGRESFVRRFPELGPAGTAFLEDAYVEILAAGDRTLLASERDASSS